jgi:hypothetical protein
MSYAMDLLWEGVIERRLWKETQVTNIQFDFMLGRFAMEVISLLRFVKERYPTDQKDLHLVFIDLEVCDRVPIDILWKSL